MMKKYYLGIDQGTTGTTAVLFDAQWEQTARGYREIRQIYPQPGWVEHDPSDVWESVLSAVSDAMNKAGAKPDQIACIGIDNEGESVVLWDRETGEPVYNAIVWQDKRTARNAEELSIAYGDFIHERTGLRCDAYFSATKIKWILDHEKRTADLHRQGRLLAGNMDAWLLFRMTHGHAHATDASTASRTMLMNIHTGKWDKDVLDLLDIPSSILPEIHDSASGFGSAEPTDFLGISAPVSGLIVDQQAALLGQACINPGMIKTTYGTGCFMLMNTGANPVASKSGLVTTVAWQQTRRRTYALDGGVYVAGAAIQWLRDGLKIIVSAKETETMAARAGSNDGVYFVPAFAGMSAPYWDSRARGMMIGITGGTTGETIVRATLESIAFQVRDVMDAMAQDAAVPITMMRCDGGASVNRFLMQFQADILGIPVDVPQITDTSALGAAYMAALGVGDLSSIHDAEGKWKRNTRFEPHMSEGKRMELLHHWHRAVDRARDWIET